MHKKVIVAGINTNVGKTIVASILTVMMDGDYWKPIQCGDRKKSDTYKIKKLVSSTEHTIHPPAYCLKTPLSPHHAARLENTSICLDTIVLPQTKRSLIIEGVGGIFTPLTSRITSADLLKTWNAGWVIVSRHYLGSINHTLLTVQALKHLEVSILGLVFNGPLNLDSERAILEISQLPSLGRLFPETNLNPQTILRYANQWEPRFSTLHL